MSDWHHHLSPFPCDPSCSTNPFTTISASCACSPSLACCFTDSMAAGFLYSACASSSLLLQRWKGGNFFQKWKLRICPLVCLLQTHPCMLKRLHDFDFFQVQIFLFFFSSFISLSEHLLSHPKSQLRICHRQRSPPLVSSCLIFFSLWPRHYSYDARIISPACCSLWHYVSWLSPLVGWFFFLR